MEHKKYRWIPLALGIASIAFFAVNVWRTRWIGDDGFIDVRVVENILNGDGPVFNVGERVEAFTSPLWILVLSALGLFGVRPDLGSVYAGLVLSTLGLASAFAGSLRLSDRGSSGGRLWPLPLGVMTYSALPPAWDYGTSGLETGLCLAWLGASFLLLSRLVERGQIRIGRPANIAYFAYLGLGPMIRPELSLFSIGMAVPICVGAWSGSENAPVPWRKRALALGAVLLTIAAVPLVYQIFRMGYFASLASNTALAKEAFSSSWTRGWHYFVNFFGLYWLFAALIPLFVFFDSSLKRAESKKAMTALAAPMVSGFLYCIYVIRVGGDFMHGRFFLPGFFGLLLPMAAVVPDIPWRGKNPRVPVAILLAAFGIWLIVCVSSLRMTVENQHSIGDERGWYIRRATTRNPTSIDDYASYKNYEEAKRLLSRVKSDCPGGRAVCEKRVLMDNPKFGRVEGDKTELPANERFAAKKGVIAAMRSAIGIFGVAGGPKIHVVDHFGLADPLASRLVLGKRGRPGHEKKLSNAWLVARFADTGGVKDKRVEAARQALDCSPLADMVAAIEEPLTVRRFLSNVKNAYRFYRLRIPPDPRKARDAFCGAGQGK